MTYMEIFPVLILIISFFVLTFAGTPIAWGIAISSTLTIIFSIPFLPSLTTIAQQMATSLDSFSLIAIPFFILSGKIMTYGGIAKRLIDFAKSIIGALPGGLALINIVSSMLMGAIAGSAMASASAMGSIIGPEMEKEGYPKEYGAAVNITSATIGLVIPPSNILIVYSLASGGVSVAALFLAGYIPGILTGIFLMIVSIFIAKTKGYKSTVKTSLLLIFKKFIIAFPSLFLLFIIIGGIVSGFFTATEASGIAVLYTFLLAFIYKEIKFNDFSKILLDASITSSIVMLLIATSMSMSWVISFENIPQELSNFLVNLSDNKLIILIIINLFILFVGIFMDITPAVLIFTPIFLPIVQSIGIDPIQFGIMLVLNLCIGLCTPPVGSVLFVGVGVAGTSIEKVFKPLFPLLISMIFSLFLITFFPKITLWLPEIFNLYNP